LKILAKFVTASTTVISLVEKKKKKGNGSQKKTSRFDARTWGEGGEWTWEGQGLAWGRGEVARKVKGKKERTRKNKSIQRGENHSNEGEDLLNRKGYIHTFRSHEPQKRSKPLNDRTWQGENTEINTCGFSQREKKRRDARGKERPLPGGKTTKKKLS